MNRHERRAEDRKNGDRRDRRREAADRRFEAADAAVARAVAAFTSKVEAMLGRWEDIEPSCILGGVMLALSEDMARLIDQRPSVGSATIKLSNALAD
jgi:hypothetical protein